MIVCAALGCGVGGARGGGAPFYSAGSSPTLRISALTIAHTMTVSRGAPLGSRKSGVASTFPVVVCPMYVRAEARGIRPCYTSRAAYNKQTHATSDPHARIDRGPLTHASAVRTMSIVISKRAHADARQSLLLPLERH